MKIYLFQGCLYNFQCLWNFSALSASHLRSQRSLHPKRRPLAASFPRFEYQNRRQRLRGTRASVRVDDGSRKRGAYNLLSRPKLLNNSPLLKKSLHSDQIKYLVKRDIKHNRISNYSMIIYSPLLNALFLTDRRYRGPPHLRNPRLGIFRTRAKSSKLTEFYRRGK